MTKEQRLAALKDTLEKLLSGPEEKDARILLWQFIQVFKARKRHDNTGGELKKLWYKIVYGVMAVDGYIRDIRVNDTAGHRLFGDFARRGRFKTLTSTLKLVQDSFLIFDPNRAGVGLYFEHPEYGAISIARYKLAVLICEVLNLYDPDHC